MMAVLLAAAMSPLPGAAQAAQPPAAHASAAAATAPAQGRSSWAAAASAASEAIPQSALPGGGAELIGRRVEEVQVTATGTGPRGWMPKLPLKVGDRLERDKLRESLHVLYLTGLFATLQADARLLPSGDVAVEFRTTPNYFNGVITASGMPKGGPNESEVVSTGRLDLGARLTEPRLKDSEDRILRLMHDYGYWQAKVSARLVRHEETQQVDVQFELTPGGVARVGKLTVTGDPALTTAEAVKICHMKPGRRVHRDILQKAVAHLRKRYVREKRLRAQLTAETPVYHAQSNTVDYSIAVDRGPVVEVSVEGFKLSRGKLKKYVPVWEEHAVDEDLLNEGRRNLRDYLQSQGYFDATVKVEQKESDDRQNIVFTIDPGERHTLRVIEIEGNQRFDTATLRERMQTQPAGFLLPRGRYSQELVSNDLDAIKALYQANGYPKVKDTSEVINDYAGKRGAMKLVIKINEGPLVRVRRLKIEGAHMVSEVELRRLINTREGQPFSEATIANDRETVLTYYFNRGFESVEFESSAKYEPGSQTWMNVAFDIHEGKQEFVNRVLVRGVVHTRPNIVHKAIVIEPREPLSQEKLLRSQRNLYDLGLFNEVDTAIQNPEGDETYKNVLFQIQEARRWTITYGGGIEIGSGLNTTQGSPQGQTGVSPRGTLNISRINFRGKDQSIIFRSHIGLLQKQVSLSFDEPHWFDLTNWRMTLTGLYDNTRDVNTFTSSREEGVFLLTEKVSRSTQMLYRFSYRRVLVDPTSFPPGFSPDLIPLYSKPVRVGMPSITYLRDRRDNPIDSTKGSYITVDFGVADSAFGSQADFGRLVAQHASYYRLGHGWVFARSTRIGFESPFGSLNIIPLPEHFFVGGSNSLRGFAINQAGPRDLDSGFPLGGSAMIVNNLELRTPPVPLPKLGNDVSFVIFHDMGNAFDTASDMWHNLLRFSQRNQQNCVYPASLTAPACDFNYMSQAIGAGIRYRTPIGPVRFDLGYNLNPPVFPVNDPCAGVVGTCTAVPHTEQLHHFNFFFSIGQTF